MRFRRDRSGRRPLRGTTCETRTRRFSWVLRGKAERTEHVALFLKLVQLLHNLLPVDGGACTRLVQASCSRRTVSLKPC